MLDDQTIIHANLGGLRDRAASLTRLTWGLGAEIALGPRLSGIIESYGQEGEHASRQIGLRIWIVPNRFQVDGTLGRQGGQPQPRSWASLGILALF